jgi:hypothetical protein
VQWLKYSKKVVVNAGKWYFAYVNDFRQGGAENDGRMNDGFRQWVPENGRWFRLASTEMSGRPVQDDGDWGWRLQRVEGDVI